MLVTLSPGARGWFIEPTGDDLGADALGADAAALGAGAAALGESRGGVAGGASSLRVVGIIAPQLLQNR